MDYHILAETTVFFDCETNSAQSTDVTINARKGYRPAQLLDKIVKNIGDGQYPVQSNLLSLNHTDKAGYYYAIPYETVIMSDQTLKNLVPDPVIKTRLSALCKHLMDVHQVGFGVEGNMLRCEHLSYFFDKAKVIGEIMDIADVEIVAGPDSQPTNVEVGYDGGDGIDDINKVNEFNVKQSRTLPNYRSLNADKNKMDMVSPYFTAMNYIELTRIQNKQNNVSVNNTKRDETNRVFVVHINSASSNGVYDLNRSATIIGIDYPLRAYNMGLSPARKPQAQWGPV